MILVNVLFNDFYNNIFGISNYPKVMTCMLNLQLLIASSFQIRIKSFFVIRSNQIQDRYQPNHLSKHLPASVRSMLFMFLAVISLLQPTVQFN